MKTNPWKVVAATAAAVALALSAPLSASAATVPLSIDNGTSSSPTAIYTGGTGAHTVEIDGSDFVYNPAWAGPPSVAVGIYVAFGPDADLADVYADASAFSATQGSQFWAHVNHNSSASDEWELTTAGDFTDLPLVVESTFTNGASEQFQCKTSPSDTTTGSVTCYIYTFSAHGSTHRGNDNKIPVYFG